MENDQIADVFEQIADLLELQEANQFRVRSYRNVARTLRGLSERVEDMATQGKDLSELPYVGESTAEKVHEILQTGTCQRLTELQGELPGGLTELMKIPQLGPRKARQLYDALGVQSIEELREACEEHRVAGLEGMGEKTEQNILKGIKTVEATSGRMLYHTAADHVESLGRHLQRCDAVERWEVAGSFRRCCETIGDLDVLVHAADRGKAAEQILHYQAVEEVTSRGEERISVYLSGGLQVDFRFFEPSCFGAALHYFTGSKAHNIAMRGLAQDRGWKLNEYGLFKSETRLAGRSEEAVFTRLGMAWVPPELREDRGEVEAAARDELPELITYQDIRGDLHSHSTATDGVATIDEMAGAAGDRGYSYLAVTDHSKAVSVAGGLNEHELREHADRIREVNEKMDGFWLLAGVEVDVLKDGRLDFEEEVLAELDWVIASIHYNLNLDEEKMTARLLSAVRSGVVHCLAHPTNRIIGRRDPLPLDLGKVFKACAEHNVCMEINAQPDRLDLPDIHCKRALEMGVTFTIGTDAHKQGGLDFLPLGVNVARRGWLRKDDVLNTLSIDQLRKRIARG